MKFSALILVLSLSAAVAQYPDCFLGMVSVGQNPTDVCLSPDGSRAYVAVGYGFATVVDINGYDDFSLAGLAAIDGEPVTLQCDASGDFLFVADQENNLVHVVNTSDLTVVKEFDIQPEPTDMVLAPTENTIYLSHAGGAVTVINTETQEVTEVFWAGSEINSLTADFSTGLVFAADNGSPDEAVINTATGSVTHFTSGIDSYGCAVSADGSRLFLSCLSWNLIEVIDTADYSIEATIPCSGDAPGKIAVLPELPYLYGVCHDQNSLLVVGTDDFTIKGEIPVTGGPENVAVHPDGERLFVVCSQDNKLKVFGFDPAGISPSEPGLLLSVTESPSPAPVVTVTNPAGGSVSVRVFDLTGRPVWSALAQTAPGSETQFRINTVPRGVYIAVATAGNLNSSVKLAVL